MCRLFGMLSTRPTDARRHLIEGECSLYAQSHIREEELQGDGWGMAYYVNGSPCVVKSKNPVYTEHAKFKAATERAVSNIIIAHVRRASNPRGLPKKTLVSLENTQPFTYGSYTFAHNGTINIPEEAAKCLGEYKDKVKGVNDSEIYFWYVVKQLETGAAREVPNSLRDFVILLDGLWEKFSNDYPGKRRPYTGLNMVFSDGKRLYALCKYDEGEGLELSLCLQAQPYFQMCYTTSKASLAVASERVGRDEHWRALGNNELLVAEVVKDEMHCEIKKLA